MIKVTKIFRCLVSGHRWRYSNSNTAQLICERCGLRKRH
jgi:transcription elongation factor Elf1